MNKLKKFRKKIELSKRIENTSITDVLKWYKNRIKIDKTKVEKIPISKLKNWDISPNGNIYHKSKQFFSLEGVRVKNASNREVKNWDQPLLFQKHGGILAILVRERNNIIEFLLNARREPGDGKSELKLCPTFSATQSNINRAHGGKKTQLSDLVLNNKNIIAKTIHYEEGARFWKKPNQNWLLYIDKKQQKKIVGKNFIWLNLSQIKKLNLKKGIINPFVKTILFII